MKKVLLITIILICIFVQGCKKTGGSNPAPRQLISVAEAKELNLRYINERSKLINSTLNIEDANATWYSLQELESYIAYTKSEGARKGYEVNGIRFYFGVYSQDKKNGDKAGLTTIFLSPTGYRNGEKASFINTSFVTKESDIAEVSPLNYGGIGHPPKLIYPANQ